MVEGSTAFAPIDTEILDYYEHQCGGTGAHVVVLFETVPGKDVPVRKLTAADIRAIWAGRITNWY
jgi:ABC-type phosphate transport system substrate-binding protein